MTGPFGDAQVNARERGVALIVTLSMLVIATILIVGFVSSMRVERQVAASTAGNTRASMFAQAALDHAVSILDQNIPQPRVPRPSPTVIPYPEYTRFGGNAVADVSAVNWVTQPGLLTTIARHTLTGTDAINRVPLSSNPNDTYASTPEDANINPPLLNGGGHLVSADPDEMRVAWVPVLRDPTAASGAANEIVGRYGFWIDDESTRANINTAYGKPSTLNFAQLTPGTTTVNGATYPLGHPSSVDLDLFGTLDRSGLATAVNDRGGLVELEDIKAFVSGDPVAFMNQNKFDLTTFSRAPEFNVFGKSKLYFLRSATGQLGSPVFQFFRDRHGPTYFPSEETANGADRHAAYYTAEAIAGYLNRNDWPGMPALSFIQKWGGAAPGTAQAAKTDPQRTADREADQIAWNLLSFGSFAGGDFTGIAPNHVSSRYIDLSNRTTSGEAGFVSVNKPNSDAVVGPLSGKAMVPAFPVPLVNEVILSILPESYTVASGPQAGEQRYRLRASLRVELWLPPGYPPYDFEQARLIVGLTELAYHVTQALPGTADATQTDQKYVLAPQNENGIRALWVIADTGVMNPGTYRTFSTGSDFTGNDLTFYVRNNNNPGGFSESRTGAETFASTGLISLDFRLRLFGLTQRRTGAATWGPKYTTQLIPVWDSHDPITAVASTRWNANPSSPSQTVLTPPADDPQDHLRFEFELDPTAFSGGPITRSLEVADPRTGGLARTWQPAPNFADPTADSADTAAAINNATTVAGYDTQKIAFADLTRPAPASDRPSTGFISVLPIGMQRGIAGATPRFQPSRAAPTLPDWLLLDLVAPNVTAANYRTMSHMNSTAGKVNLNSVTFPDRGRFTVPPRFVPIQALVQNMKPSSTVFGSGRPSVPSAVARAITRRTLSSSGGISYGAPEAYDYEGEIAEIEGVADSGATDWERESLIRNLASSMTTKSNTFSVWGVAQAVKKNPANTTASNRGIFETRSTGAAADDLVVGERRFQAVVERYVWPGADSAPGNARVNNSGNYDRTSSGQTQPGYPPPYAGGTWEMLDGPDPPTYPITFPVPGTSGAWTAPGPAFTGTFIEEAHNPTRALMKYRVIYFRYLNE